MATVEDVLARVRENQRAQLARESFALQAAQPILSTQIQFDPNSSTTENILAPLAQGLVGGALQGFGSRGVQREFGRQGALIARDLSQPDRAQALLTRSTQPGFEGLSDLVSALQLEETSRRQTLEDFLAKEQIKRELDILGTPLRPGIGRALGLRAVPTTEEEANLLLRAENQRRLASITGGDGVSAPIAQILAKTRQGQDLTAEEQLVIAQQPLRTQSLFERASEAAAGRFGTKQKTLLSSQLGKISEGISAPARIEPFLDRIRRISEEQEGEPGLAKVSKLGILRSIPDANEQRLASQELDFLAAQAAVAQQGARISDKDFEIFQNFLNSPEGIAANEIIPRMEKLIRIARDDAASNISIGLAQTQTRQNAENLKNAFLASVKDPRERTQLRDKIDRLSGTKAERVALEGGRSDLELLEASDDPQDQELARQLRALGEQ